MFLSNSIVKFGIYTVIEEVVWGLVGIGMEVGVGVGVNDLSKSLIEG